MAETYSIRDLLLPELDAEISKTRRVFEALPDENGIAGRHYKNLHPQPSSISITELASPIKAKEASVLANVPSRG